MRSEAFAFTIVAFGPRLERGKIAFAGITSWRAAARDSLEMERRALALSEAEGSSPVHGRDRGPVPSEAEEFLPVSTLGRGPHPPILTMRL